MNTHAYPQKPALKSLPGCASLQKPAHSVQKAEKVLEKLLKAEKV